LLFTLFLAVEDAAAASPEIEGESVTGVSETSAVLHAQINTSKAPDGAYYQFQLVEDPSEYRSEVSCPEDDPEPPEWQCFGSLLYGGGIDHVRQPGDLPTKRLLNAPEGQAVSLDLGAIGVELKPQTTYHYRVVVVEREQEVDTIQWRYPPVHGADQTFFTGTESEPPPGEEEKDGASTLPIVVGPAPEVDDPPVRHRLNRCQRQQKRQARQKKDFRPRLQCKRVSVKPRVHR